jgi:uncharacterized membrane protein (UPF0136 family)
MTVEAFVSCIYGFAMAGGGYAGFRRAGSVPSLVAGGVVGALALLGGIFLAIGNDSGRNLVLLGAIPSALFFGWKSLRSIAGGRRPGRAMGIFMASLLTAGLLFLFRGSSS